MRNVLALRSTRIFAPAMLLLALFATPAHAGVSLSIQPDSTCAEHLEIFTVYLWVDSAGSAFDGYETTICFDPAHVTYMAVAQESLMLDPPGGTWWHPEPSDSSIFISHVLLSGGFNITGPGALSSIQFRATSADGVMPIRFGETDFFLAGSYVENVETHDGVARIAEDCTPVGACCFQTGACEVLSSADCTGLGGIWRPEWPDCDPNPCATSGVAVPPAGGARLLTPTPNPATGAVMLGWQLGTEADLTLEIYDTAGRRVIELVRGRRAAGIGGIQWTGCDAAGHPQPRGTYFCRLHCEGRTETRALTLLR